MNKSWPFAVLLLALAATPGCVERSEPPPLTAEELLLVEDLVELYTLRVLRFAQPDSASRRRESLRLNLGDTELEAQIERLAADPVRGHMMLEAVHDSLEALRPRLFPSSQG
ncbi:MAG: hypothetical protein HKO53_07695 [Gemmatimonadetes bacterium]|nr:hypothetical protein [Gemmatimonadota bacterium]